MEYLFVYGMFRDSANGLLQDSKFCNKDYINAKMYRVNDFWPGIILDNKSKVIGDIYLIDPNIFTSLDEFEGSEYRRVKVTTLSGIDCWVYEWTLDIDGFKEIEGGDWILR